MTGPANGGTERDTRAPSRPTWTQGAIGALVVVLAVGLVLRLILARLLPGSGFEVDLGAFRYWASNLANEGLFGFYGRDFFHDYTPGYLYVLWVVGVVGNALGGVGDLIKIPPILSDLAVGYLAWSMVRELGGRDRLALAAAAVAVLNPITWFDSVVWGQVDSFGVVFLLLGLRELWRDRPERAAIYTVIAAVIKPQLGILIPLVAVVTIRRALWPAGGFGDAERTGRPVRILTTGVAGFLTAVVLSLPFGLSVIEFSARPPFIGSGLLQQVGVAAGGYPYLTVNAYNPWALVPSNLGQSLASAGQWVCDYAGTTQDCGAGVAVFGGIPAVVIGTALLLLAIVAILVVVARRPDRLTLLVGLAVLALAFFVVPTRVHERYGYPFFAMGVILAAISWRWRVAYLVLSVATFANMYVVLTTLYPDNPSVADWLGLGPSIRSPLGVALFSLMHAAAFVWAFVQLRAGARERLEDELAAASVRDDDGFADEPRPDRDGRAADAGPGGPPRRHARHEHRDGRTATRRPDVSRGLGRCHSRSDRRRPGPHAHLDAPGELRGARHPGLVPRSAQRRVDPARPQRAPAIGTRRTARPARPVVRHRPHRRVDGPAHLPARRAVADALRRGLPRPDRGRVPPGLAVRATARRLRMDPPTPREVRDGRRHGPVGAGWRSPRRATSRCRSWRSPSRRDGSTKRRPAIEPASDSTSRPARRSARTTCGRGRSSRSSPRPECVRWPSTTAASCSSPATTTGASRPSSSG